MSEFQNNSERRYQAHRNEPSWTRRALAVILAIAGISAGVGIAATAGSEILDAYQHPSSPENDSARSIDLVYENGLWQMPLKDGIYISAKSYGDSGDTSVPKITPIRVNEGDIVSIEGQTVNGNLASVRNVGEDMETGTVPLLAVVKIDGQDQTVILEPDVNADGNLTSLGTKSNDKVHVERNDQGQLTTSDGQIIDNVSFTSTSETH